VARLLALAAAARLAATARRRADALGRAMGLVAGWAIVLCALFIAAEVLARNLIRVSSQSTTEVSGYMLAFSIAWALAHALTTRNHVRIDVLINRLPVRVRVHLHVLALALLAGFAGFAAQGALGLVLESWDFGATDISLLRTPLVIPQGLWAFGLCVFLVLILLMLAEALLLLAAGNAAEIDRRLGPRSYEEEAAEALQAAGTAPQAVGTAPQAVGTAPPPAP
jgi:TRAP-type C4-dicarboxylate transport system permease small subunit